MGYQQVAAGSLLIATLLLVQAMGWLAAAAAGWGAECQHLHEQCASPECLIRWHGTMCPIWDAMFAAAIAWTWVGGVGYLLSALALACLYLPGEAPPAFAPVPVHDNDEGQNHR